MGEILIGTSGFSYTDWVGTFYPEKTEKKDFLEYYAKHFPFSELNFTYYRQPDPSLLKKFAASTPDDFLFIVKGHQSLTHQVTGNWRDEAVKFSKGVEPLLETEKLAGILLQFPYSFHYTPEKREYLANLTEKLKHLPLLVEYRCIDWQQDRVFDGMQERKIGLVNTDMPALKGLPEPTAVVTSDTGYLRFHGRNSENWWSGDNTSRYDYLYSNEELAARLPDIKKMAAKTKRLLIAFNNHYKAKAVQNANQLTKLLK